MQLKEMTVLYLIQESHSDKSGSHNTKSHLVSSPPAERI